MQNTFSAFTGIGTASQGAQVSAAKFTSLEDMNNEAQEMLRQKKEELQQYQNIVFEAEQILSKLKAEIDEKTKTLEALSAQNNTDEDELEQQTAEHELAMLQQKHEEEIQQMKAQHEEEMHSLRADYQQSLNEAENWANRHSQIALQEKMEELEQLRHEAEATKRQLDEVTFITSRTPGAKEAELDSRRSAQEIAALENQISELTSITREELRDSRAKIDETLAAIELRRQSHEAEVRRLDEEIRQRGESYEQHLEAVRQQYANERQTVEQSIAAANAKSESTERIISQLEKHHEAQLNQVLGDIETMRRSTGLGGRPRQSVDEVRGAVREAQRLAEEVRALDEEIRMVDAEAAALASENRELQQELLRYSAALQRLSK